MSMSVVKEPLKKDSRSHDGRVSCDASCNFTMYVNVGVKPAGRLVLRTCSHSDGTLPHGALAHSCHTSSLLCVPSGVRRNNKTGSVHKSVGEEQVGERGSETHRDKGSSAQ